MRDVGKAGAGFINHVERRMRKSIVLGSLAALGLTGQAIAADGFSYSYLEAAYVSTDLDGDVVGTNVDGDGFALKGSIAFSDMIHGYVDYSRQDFDFVDIDSWEVGVGFNHALSSNLDLIGRAGYAKFDAEVVDDDGFALQAGVRGRPADGFEIEGLIHYVDLSDSGDGTSAIVNGRYFFTDTFAAGAGVEFGNDATTWNVGLRYTFNNK
jgi:hypothetical protein